jgi:hypothetical protein
MLTPSQCNSLRSQSRHLLASPPKLLMSALVVRVARTMPLFSPPSRAPPYPLSMLAVVPIVSPPPLCDLTGPRWAPYASHHPNFTATALSRLGHRSSCHRGLHDRHRPCCGALDVQPPPQSIHLIPMFTLVQLWPLGISPTGTREWRVEKVFLGFIFFRKNE